MELAKAGVDAKFQARARPVHPSNQKYVVDA
ncbi:MAG: hypothetical protein RIS54_1123 [Verrucomicrobiota bacterium]|jgi:hypothetical protein